MNKYIEYIKNKAKNKRIVTAVLIIVALFSLLGPFAKLDYNASVSIPFTTNKFSYESDTIGSLSLRNFANQSNVSDIKINNRSLGSFEILGVNFYDSLKNPPEISKQLETAINTLNPDFLKSLSAPTFKQQLKDLSPKNGENIYNLLSDTGQKLLGVRESLVTIKPAAKEFENTLGDISNIVLQIENYKTIANIFVLILFIITIVSAVLFTMEKVPLFIPRLLAIISFILILVMAITIPIINKEVNVLLNQITSSLNDNINSQVNIFLNNLLGDKAALFSLFGGSNNDYISFNIGLGLGWGAIIAIISLVAAIIISFIIPKNILVDNVLTKESNEASESNFKEDDNIKNYDDKNETMVVNEIELKDKKSTKSKKKK